MSLTAVLFLAMPISTKAQVADSMPVPKKGSYVASYWKNGLSLVASPIHYKADDWAKVGATLVITGLTIGMDEAVSQPFFNWQSKTGKAVGDAGYFIGTVPVQLSISGLAFGAGLAAHNKPLQYFALDNLQAQIYTGGATWLVKTLAHRARPNAGQGAFEWGGPLNDKGNESFFSGHSSIAFSTATMIFLHSKKKWWVGLLSYGAATGVAIGRMQRQAHWASDVLMGAVVGSAISSFVYKKQEKRRNPIQKLKIIP